MTFIYVMPLHEEQNGYGVLENGGLPPPNNVSHDVNQETTKHEEKPKGRCQRILTNVKDKVLCKSCRKGSKPIIPALKHDAEADSRGCFSCNKNKRKSVRISIENEDPKPTFWERLKCCGKNKITDTSGCLPIGRRKPSWVGRRDSILSEVPKQSDKCSKFCCKLFMRRLFCLNCCKSKKKVEEDAFSRRASTMSKKKSLTLTGPVEDHKPKLDLSLVEHTSHMKAAIPVLPICLAWFCLIMNCLFPGTGTILSGLFCLCVGKPRFSQKDGARPRIGAFIINLIIGFGQFFTVLFCLVGWGWSIWWGIIMVRLARKSRKIDAIAKAELDAIPRPVPAKQNHRPRDPELGS